MEKKTTMRERREQLKLTLEEVAARAGMTSSAVRQMEVGAFNGSLFAKIRIADALELAFKELWPDTMSEMTELEEIQKRDRKRSRFITTNDFDNKGKLTPAARARQLTDKLLEPNE